MPGMAVRRDAVTAGAGLRLRPGPSRAPCCSKGSRRGSDKSSGRVKYPSRLSERRINLSLARGFNLFLPETGQFAGAPLGFKNLTVAGQREQRGQPAGRSTPALAFACGRERAPS